MKIAIIVLLILGGLVLLLGAIFSWDWMLRSRRSRYIVERLGIEQGRIIYGVIGIILIIIALIVMLVPKVSQTITGKPDALAILSVKSDGCSVLRSEVAGTTSLQYLQWIMTNANFETVFTRRADVEYEYRYNRSGEYFVVIQAWYGGGWVTISNKVKINCTSLTP